MTSISDLSPAQFSDALKAWNDAVKEDAVFSQTDSASFQVGGREGHPSGLSRRWNGLVLLGFPCRLLEARVPVG